MKAVYIYALKDPVTGLIRYIGKTTNPKTRLNKHVCDAKTESGYRANWICSLLKNGLRPEFEMLAQVPEDEWPQHEMDYIAVFRLLGCNLTNTSEGGENPPSWRGRKHSLEARAKMRGRKLSPETRAKISATHLGMKPTFETLAKMRGKKRSSEYCSALSARQLGRKQSPEHIANRAATRVGKKQSAETITKRAATWKLNREKKLYGID